MSALKAVAQNAESGEAVNHSFPRSLHLNLGAYFEFGGIIGGGLKKGKPNGKRW